MVFARSRLPQQLLSRLFLILPKDKYYSVLHAYSLKRPITLRANTLKIKSWELRQRLLNQGIKVDTVFWYKDAFIVRNKTRRELEKTSEYQNGLLYLQSLSSMIPSLVLAPKPGEKILDMAAAPGSKTTQLASLMQNQGELVANEPNTIRFQKLKANIARQGVTNVKLVSIKGENISSIFTDYFDKVLVDAPCSGEGRICFYSEDSYRYWSLKNVFQYAALQKKLLISAFLAVKPGGVVVYSTCTLSPEENEEVISWLLERAEGKIKTEEIYLNGLKFAPSISKWGGKSYHYGVNFARRIIPSDLMEGFFVAKLRKISN